MIRLEQLAVTAGSFRLEGISLEIPRGELGVLMGKTGCGKTTLIECMCGLRQAVAGRIFLDGRDVTRLPPAARNIGYVPQDKALFPKMKVRRQLSFPLMIRKWRRADVERRTHELVDMLAIRHLLDRHVTGLSGGEAQRVALGRALSWRPTTLVLDEPLSALDEDTRTQMADLLKQVQRETGVTMLHVTHSRAEANRLADRLLLLKGGNIIYSDHQLAGDHEVPEPSYSV